MTLPKEVSIGSLRESLKYRSREAMNANWSFVFAGEILPEDHLFVPIDQALEFVGAIAVPQRGRPGSITGAAQQLLKSWSKPAKIAEPEPAVLPTKIAEPEPAVLPTKIAEPEPTVLPTKIAEPEPTVLPTKIAEPEPTVLPTKIAGSKKNDSWYLLALEKTKVELSLLPEEDRTGKKGTELSKKIRFLEFKLSEQKEDKRTVSEKVFDFFAGLSGLDWVYLVTVGIADYGLAILLKEMGLAAGVVYTLISFHALAMAKNRKSQVTANRGITAVWLLETLAFFVHLTLFNRRLWGTIEELPFTAAEDVADEYRPFLIALILAALFSAAGIYAVSTTLALLKERIEAEEYELTHGKQY